MTHVLRIESSATPETSRTWAANQRILETLNPTRVVTRDLNAGLPQVDANWVQARLVAANERSDDQAAALALSDTLIGEIQDADTLLIGMPIYNFGMPAALKLWVDLIARPKVTFEYTPNGPRGLLHGKKAIVSVAAGGTPIGAPFDYATPHLRHVLGFVGIDDVQLVDLAQDQWADTLAA